MARLSALIMLFILSALPGSTAPLEVPAAPPSVCAFPISQTIRIPLSTRLPNTSEDGTAPDAADLLATAGATDELPVGPAGFDLLDDGSLVITDPLRSRLALFDSQGKFRQSWKVGFAADSVTVGAHDLLLVEEAATGVLHALDRTGRLLPDAPAKLPAKGEASVLSTKTGALSRVDRNGQYHGALEIRFDRPGASLLSLEAIATDTAGYTYVALESTAEGETSEEVNIDKVVRKYDPSGTLIGETSSLPLDYFVTPVNEVRVRKGSVYQLQTTKSEVRVNVWNMNEGCGRP